MPELDSAKLVFLDETWATTNMTRTRGRAPRGQRLIGVAPHGHVWTPAPVQGESVTRILRVIGCCHVFGL